MSVAPPRLGNTFFLGIAGVLSLSVGAAASAAEIDAIWTGAADATAGVNNFDWDDAGNWDIADYPDADHPNVGDAYHVFFNATNGFDNNDDAVMLGGDREVLSLHFAADIDKGTESVTFDGGQNPTTTSGNTLTIVQGLIDDKSSGFTHFAPLVKFGTSTVTVNREGGNRELRFTGIEMGDGDLLIKTGGGRIEAVDDNSNRFFADIRVDGGVVALENGNGGWGDGLKSDGVTRQTVTVNASGIFRIDSGNGDIPFDFLINAGGEVNLDTGNLALAGTITGDGTLSNTRGATDNRISGDASGFTGSLLGTHGDWVIQNILGTGDITADASNRATGVEVAAGGLVVFNDGDTISLLGGATGDFADGGFDVTGLDAGQSHTLVDYTTGSITYAGDVADLLNTASATAGWQLTDTGTRIVAVIPEPASLALLGLGGVMMLRRRGDH